MILLAFNWSSLFANIGQFILAFSILIVLHELGHFLTARWFGCRVEKFYLFFNPWFSLWKKKKGDTEYGLGWIPLGGYVKISGMVDESMDKEQMKQPPQPYEFRSKPAWQRLIIMVAGVIMNFVLALIIFAGILFAYGEEKLPVANLKYGLAADSLALSVGLKDGDKIVAVNDKPLVYQNDLAKAMLLSSKVFLTVNREGRDTTINFPEGFLRDLTRNQLKDFVTVRTPVIIDSVDPKSIQYVSGQFEKGDRLIGMGDHHFNYFHEFDELKKKYKEGDDVEIKAVRNENDTTLVKVEINKSGGIGFLPLSPEKIFGTEKKEYGFFQAIPAGINYGVTRLGEYIRGIRLLFTSKEHRVQDNLGSVISIGKTFGGVWDWQRFWMMTALFSIILAFMNILPIPALDGGHALFTVYEIVSGRKPSDKFMEYAQMVGMILLLGLMAYALGLDIFRLFK
jgi:regulator of sigma E protease